jgi:purine-cytosine permease-like protein
MTRIEASLPALQVSYEDDPRVLAEAATEDYSLHVVPRSWQMNRYQLTQAFFAVATTFFYLYFAGFIALAYGTVNALIGIGLSVVVYVAVNSVIVRAASASGLTVALFSRSLFGFVGAAIATLIFAATAVYFLVFEASVIAVAAREFFGGALKMWYAIVIASTAPLVWRGVRVWLDRLNAFLLPFFVITLAAVIVWALADRGYHGFLPGTSAAAGTTLPWLQAFSAYMGVWILMMYTMDFARLGRPEDDRYHIAVTFGWVFYLISFVISGLIGILLVSTFGIDFASLAGQESALPVEIVGLTGILGLALIAITQTRINTVNLYLASTNLQSFVARVFGVTLPRTLWVLVACAIGYLLMLTNVFSYVNDALAYQGIAIVAWVGVALVHLAWLRRSGRDLTTVEFRPGRIPAFNPGGLGAWFGATALGVVLKVTDTAGSQLFEICGLLLTFALACVLYGIALTFARPSWFAMARPHDPLHEVADRDAARIRCHACDHSYAAREMDRDPSAGHEAICAACASTPHRYAATRAEAGASAKQLGQAVAQVPVG